ncbi:MAG: hypothetical protein CME59_17790 [Halioglobus sp.]|nr:hypothetical protein [Halioglobus sp.]|tara:strand:+ start:8663 stop:8845 length:183 start_codon:yes stop_codon:yes gene_type:complete
MAKKSRALQIRIEEQLHQEFLDTCHNEDRPAAQVLREFMREFIAEHQPQQPLFTDEPRSA